MRLVGGVERRRALLQLEPRVAARDRHQRALRERDFLCAVVVDEQLGEAGQGEFRGYLGVEGGVLLGVDPGARVGGVGVVLGAQASEGLL